MCKKGITSHTSHQQVAMEERGFVLSGQIGVHVLVSYSSGNPRFRYRILVVL